MFRGGAYKPRTSPYAFQGMGVEGLKILAEVRERFGMLIVTRPWTPRPWNHRRLRRHDSDRRAQHAELLAA